MFFPRCFNSCSPFLRENEDRAFENLLAKVALFTDDSRVGVRLIGLPSPSCTIKKYGYEDFFQFIMLCFDFWLSFGLKITQWLLHKVGHRSELCWNRTRSV